MTITPKTTVHTLLKEHPFLLDFLAGYDPEFKKLTNPVLRRTMGRMATLEKASEMGNVPLDQLMNDIAAEIQAKTGARPDIADTPGVDTMDPARLEELHAIVMDLHAGKSVEEVKPRFEELIADVEATEIAAMEQKLIEGGVPETEVKRLCDVHVQVFADALEGHEPVKTPAGHPVDTFQRENRALLQVTASLRKVAEKIGEPPVREEWERLKPALAGVLDRLLESDKHYLRKENQLFPFLEKHGIEGPSKVMWAIHDDIRALMKQARAALAEDDAAMAVSTAQAVAKMADDMVTKEEKVLYPMAIDTLDDDEWRQIRAGEDEIGYALIGDVPAWPAGAAGAPAAALGYQFRRRERRGALLQRGRAHLPALTRRDRPQGPELPPAGERAQGAGDRRRLPRRREGRRRVLDRHAGQVPAHPLLRPPRHGRRLSRRRRDGAGRDAHPCPRRTAPARRLVGSPDGARLTAAPSLRRPPAATSRSRSRGRSPARPTGGGRPRRTPRASSCRPAS
jgi:hemerythrin-like domain-containing protein